jgi:hypothetical protein
VKELEKIKKNEFMTYQIPPRIGGTAQFLLSLKNKRA